MTVSAGTVAVTASGGLPGGTSRVPSLAVGAGRFDLRDNKLITQEPVGTWGGSNYGNITGLIASGRNGGGWGGSGIVTSMTDATQSILTSIGVATAAQV